MSLRQLVLGLAVAIGFCVIAIVGSRSEQRSRTIQQELLEEFLKIAPPPDARERSRMNSHKLGSAWVIVHYGTAMPFAELTSYYDASFRKAGWQNLSEENVRHWGQATGGRIIRYRKGRFSGSIEYSGDDYTIAITWGIYGS